MIKKITLLSFLILLSFNLILAQHTQPGEIITPPKNKIEFVKEGLELENFSPEVPKYVAPEHPAKMKFEHEEFNFGTIERGEKVKNVFEFTNTSEVPLVITNAKGSCGCTVPEWPREPIMPGESSYFLVVFDSKGKKGNQAKRVTITANTEVAHTYLYLKGTVDIEKELQQKKLKNRSVDENFFTVYPNPAAEVVNIKLEEYKGEKAQIEIFDRSGKLMLVKAIDQIEETPYTLDISLFNSGIYTATIVVGDKMRLAKQFVVQ